MVVEHRALAPGGKTSSAPTSRGRLAQLRPERLAGVPLARDARAAVGDVVEQDHPADLAAGARPRRRGSRAGRRTRSPCRVQPGGSSSPSKRTKRISRMARRAAPPAGTSGQLDHRRRSRRRCRWRRRTLRVVLGVVVGADQDRRTGVPGSSPTMFRRPAAGPVPGTARSGRAGASGAASSASRRSCGEPAGLCPTPTCRSTSAMARVAVEAVGLAAERRRRRSRPARARQQRSERAPTPRPPACPCA